MIEPTHFLEITTNSWNEMKLIGEKLNNSYIFRGQSNSDWPLQTSIERITEKNKDLNISIAKAESNTLSNFKSRAHNYIQSPPADNDILEWLALIQHYGGVTRLLDFTESFYVASFFAVESYPSSPCVWAVSIVDLLLKSGFTRVVTDSLAEFETEYTFDGVQYNELIKSIVEDFITNHAKEAPLIFKVIPSRLNDRLAAQKGLFLVNCSTEKSFENSLCKTLHFPFDTLASPSNATNISGEKFLSLPTLETGEYKGGDYKSKEFDIRKHAAIAPVIKINLPTSYQREAIINLDSMNINYASLFPGLSGFTKSLNIFFSKGYDLSVTKVKHRSPSSDTQALG